MLSVYKEHFDNAYQEIFQKVLVGKSICNMRFEPVLKFGESVERVMIDTSGVRVRSTNRTGASIIDTIADSSELLTINLEKEAVFYISDGEATQSGPLNPGEVIGGQIAIKVATDLDARILGEVKNAAQTFDTGDLTALASNGVSIVMSAVTVPQMVTRMPAKLRRKNQILTNLMWVLDSYGASDIEQFLIGKSFDLAGVVFKNGYAGEIRNATMIVSENLTGEALLTGSGVFVGNETLVINGVTLKMVAALSVGPAIAGEVLIGAALTNSLTNLAAAINNPATTSGTFTALAVADQILFVDDYKLSAVATATTLAIVGLGAGRMNIAETGANFVLTSNFIDSFYGKKGAIDLVVQNLKEVDMRKTSDRRGTNVFTSYLAGLKTFADGAKKFLWVKISV